MAIGNTSLMLLGYEPADLNMHPHPKTIDSVFFISHRCLVPPNFFPQGKSGFCRRYSHKNAQNRRFTS